jgi:hypothetical protein
MVRSSDRVLRSAIEKTVREHMVIEKIVIDKDVKNMVIEKYKMVLDSPHRGYGMGFMSKKLKTVDQLWGEMKAEQIKINKTRINNSGGQSI